MIKPERAPYRDTKVHVEQTRADINRLLSQFGILDTQWTTAWSINKVSLRFITEGKNGKKVAFEISPPTFTAKRKTWDAKKGGYETVEAPNWPQSFRMLLDYLKAKLRAVAYGLREVEEEFLNDMVVHDEAGRETTVGKLVRPAIAGGRITLPQLDAPQDRSNVQDTNGTVVG